MNKIRQTIIFLITACLLLATLFGCQTTSDMPKTLYCTVLVEDSDDYVCEHNVISSEKNKDVTVEITIGVGYSFSGVNYDDYAIDVTDGEASTTITILLKNVKYSLILKPLIQKKPSKPIDGGNTEPPDLPNEPSRDVIFYDSNDGSGRTLRSYSKMANHYRANTLSAQFSFERNGYVQTGWNTATDGNGTHVGFGSRCDRVYDLTLYAEWAKVSAENLFTYELKYGNAVITGCKAPSLTDLVIPEKIDGYNVTGIAEGAFCDLSSNRVVIPKTVRAISDNAFTNLKAKEIVLFDSINILGEKAFLGAQFDTLYINANRSPVYAGTYYSVFADKCDRLMSLANEKKMILAGGSAWRFGCDSKKLGEHYEEYEVVNMGVFAYANMLPQYLIMLKFMKEGDLLLSSPEFDAIDCQFCTSRDIDYSIFAMVETNYDLFSYLDCKDFSNVTEALSDYLMRSGNSNLTYEETPYYVDEDGFYSTVPVYNEYGDYILPRPNNEEMISFGVKRAYYSVKYFPEAYIETLNEVYQKFLSKNVKVLFVYSPRSKVGLSVDTDEASIAELDDYLNERICVPIIGSIHESIMSPYYFYATDNHLSTEGVEIRTDSLINDLDAYFAK